jgi:DNA-binding CsgD family transcriptional regulator
VDARQLVARARQAAVATDGHDRIRRTNKEFHALIGWRGRRSLAGRSLSEFLRPAGRARTENSHQALWEALAAGDGAEGFEVELAAGNDGLRLSACPLIFTGDDQVVYLFESRQRRRLADEVIDRLLAATDPGSPEGLPSWWTERRSPEVELTRRQLEVLDRLTRGEALAAIAGAMGTSLHTVRTHVQAVYERLGVHSRAQAVAFALRHRAGGGGRRLAG